MCVIFDDNVVAAYFPGVIYAILQQIRFRFIHSIQFIDECWQFEDSFMLLCQVKQKQITKNEKR